MGRKEEKDEKGGEKGIDKKEERKRKEEEIYWREEGIGEKDKKGKGVSEGRKGGREIREW